MVQQLKTLAAPAKDSGSQKRIVWLTNTYNFSPGGSEALFWLLKAQVQVWRPHTHTLGPTYIYYKIKENIAPAGKAPTQTRHTNLGIKLSTGE